MKHFHRTKPGGASVYRRLALLLLAAIIGGLIEPLLPAQTAAAQRISGSSTVPSSSLGGQSTAPSAASAPAATAAQQSNLVNVARGKKATQTNVNPFVNDPYPGAGPARAVDGGTSGNPADTSLMQTWGNNHDPNDWWQVDLGGRYPIERIDVWNRTDALAAQLHDFYVFVSDTPFVSNELSAIQAQAGVGAYFTAGVAAATTSIAVNRTGRYVRVVLSQPGALSLAEVQVWSKQSTPDAGTEGPYNVAERKATRQTNVNDRFSDPYPNGDPGHAVDGFLDGNYSANTSARTWGNNHDPLDWWEVDLGGVYPIDSVDLWNRTDAEAVLLHNFYVLVSEAPFESNDLNANKNQPFVSAYFVKGQAERTTNVAVNRTGRYVRVVLSEPGILSLTEVQVWSKQSKALDAPASIPIALAVPADSEMYLYWLPVPGATTYRVQRASAAGGPYTTVATNVTTRVAIGGSSMFEFIDSNVANDTPYYYIVRAIGPLGGVRGVSSEVMAYPTGPVAYSVFQEVLAANFYVQSGITSLQDSGLGRAVVGSVDSGDYLAFRGMDFGAGAHAVTVKYAAAQAAGATINFYTSPSEDSLIASVPVTSTGGLDQWGTGTAIVQPTQGVQTVYVRFTGKGADLLRMDSFEFLQRGPYDTDTVKWDPNIVLLQKAMGITLDTYIFNTSDNGMLMTFSASAEEGRQALASVQVGSIIASDTNLDLGGPYARVLDLVSMSADQIAVRTQYVPFNQLIVAGGIDLTDAINQSFNDAAASLAGTSALTADYDPAGYDTIIPNVVYEGDTGGQASRTAGMGSLAAQTSDVPTVTVPKEAKGTRTGHFHVTLDNIQFISDEDGFGLELVNLKMNALGVQPLNGSNPVASQFGFGVLGGVGADKVRAQVRLEFPNAMLTRDNNVDIGSKVSFKAHFQAKALAVGMWFFDIPAKWIKPIRFPVPTPVGPMPSSLVFGVQGYIIAVGLGNITAEYGLQVSLQPTNDPSKLLQVKPFGDTKLDIGQKVENVSLLGFALEPYAKVRFGDFSFAPDVISWVAFSLGLGFDSEKLKKLEGLVVFTFTPRGQLLNILKNWKDKDTPIFEQKACVQPVAKAEALPGFPKKMTFELRVEVPVHLCVLHTGWLYYDMKVEDSYQIDPKTSEAEVDWSVPIISEKSTIPHKISWYGPVPYELEQAPVVESRNIADAFPFLNAAERRMCVLYQRPFVYKGVRYPVKIIYSGPCQENAVSRVKLPEGFSSAPYTLRVMTEYRLDNPLNSGSTEDLAQQIDCDIVNMAVCGTFGVWSEKNFTVNASVDDSAFTVNSTQVFTQSATQLDAIEGTECDPDAQKALGMELTASITPKPADWWRVQSAELLVDGVAVEATMSDGASPGEKILRARDQDLAAGAHTLKIVAKLYQPDVVFPGIPTGKTRTATYYATFKAKPKTCGRAKSDEMAAVIFENSKCSNKQTPFYPLDVLGNDDLSGGGTWEISGVSGARLGQVKVSDDKQQLLYKPSSPGVDTFTYDLTYTTSNGFEVSKGSVLVNNRLASTDEDCAGGPGGNPGGGDPGGNPGGKGRIVSWGDPHITTADGKYFDSHAFGEFIYIQPKPGKSGFTLQGRQQPWTGNRAAGVMTALAFKINGHVVEFRARNINTVLVDGQAPTGNTIDLGNNATLTTSQFHSQIDLPNTHIDVQIIGEYINLTIDLPLDGAYEGMFGSNNGNKADDWQAPDGSAVADAIQLADAWRITDRSLSLFTYEPGEDPSTFNQPNRYLNELPTAAQLAPFKEQARTLLTSTCDTAGKAVDETQIEAMAVDMFFGADPEEFAAQLCTYEVKGTITSSTLGGAPVVGAAVRVISDETKACAVATNRTGSYTCKLAPKPGGSVPAVQIKINGVLVDSFSFAGKAPIHGSLSEQRDLSVSLPSVNLTVRTLDNTGNPAANTAVTVRTSNVTRQVSTGADGTTTLLLTYPLGTTSTWVEVIPLAPAHGYSTTKTTALNPNVPASLTIETKHVLLGTPSWVRAATGTNGNKGFSPMVGKTAPALGADGTVYTIGQQSGSNSGTSFRLVATNPDGTPKWVSTGFGTVENGAPSVGPDGTIYLLAKEYPVARLHAFNANGSLKWTFTLPENYYYTSTTATIGADGAVYFVAAEYDKATAKMYGIDQASGAAVWSYDLGERYGYSNSTPSTPVFGPNGALYFVGERLWGFYPDGTVKQSTFETYNDAQIAVGPSGILYVSTGSRIEGHGAQTWAVNPDLTLRWTKYVGGYYAPVVAPDGSIYVGDGDGLKKLNPATGNTVWTVSAYVQSAPLVSAEGTVYVMVQAPSVSGLIYSGQLLGVQPDGTVVSRFNTRSPYGTHALKMAADGTVYATIYSASNTSYNDLYAIPTGSAGLAGGWSSAWGNPQNTNR
ncbi:MAG TPA: carbohydrate-binding protein [Roseiflexaceae bacterium]|nr:carbohydrate-binding protein [Roseiflexaceae bacterium]